MPDLNDTTALETRLRRFLYIGKERPEYHPGNWFTHNYYDVKNLSSIDELIAKPDKIGPIIFLVHEAFTRNLVVNPETLIFALAVSSQQDKNKELREKAYTAVKFICIKPEHFILFNKFASQLSKKVRQKTGWGQGWRKAVKAWYNDKTAEELAIIATRCMGRYGWKHRDILKMAHYKTEDETKNLVVEYMLHGLKKTKEKYANKQLNEEQEKIMQILTSVEDFKHCEDEVTAAGLVESLRLSLDHVPGHLLKSREVWQALLSSMSIEEVLQHLQRIHNLKFLESDTQVSLKVLDILSEQNFIQSEKPIHPAVFLIALKDYENSGKPLSLEKRKVRENSKTPIQKPPPPNKKILLALGKLLDLSFMRLQEASTNVHYMVTINMNKAMTETGCWHCGNVFVAEAGCLIALSLLRAEKDVTVATFTKDGIQCIELDANSNFHQAMNQLKQYESTVEIIDLSKPMTWAAEKKKSIDVFINVVDQIYQKSDHSEAGIKAYRSNMNQPNAKLVNCAMSASATYNKNTYDNHILTICGFDEKVPKVIEAFARSFF